MSDIRTTSDVVTIIGPDCTIKGEIAFEGTMKVEGRIEGKVTSKGRLSLGRSAHVAAEVAAGHISVEGSFKGNAAAAERIELAATAHVLGDIRAPKLVVAEGATFVGNCHVSPDALKGAPASEFVVPMAATPLKK